MTRIPETSARLSRLLPLCGLLLFAGLLLNATPATAFCGNNTLDFDEVCDDNNLVDLDGCNSICQTEGTCSIAGTFCNAASDCPEGETCDGATCVDDVTGVTNNCTANDVRIALVLNQEDTTCELGTEVELNLIGKLVANASERWDIGMFIALDGGEARTGLCHQQALPPPLAPDLPACEGTCTGGTVSSCFKDADCDPGFFCTGGYEPGSITLDIDGKLVSFVAGGPFYDGECSEDPADLCGDLEQGVDTIFEFPNPLTVPCQDTDGDGAIDIGSCVSWDNARSAGTNNKPSCRNIGDTEPNTKAKCRCETINIGNVFVAGKIIVQKDVCETSDAEFDFALTGGPDGVNQLFTLGDEAEHDSGSLKPSFLGPATYSVVETVPSGWQATIVCTNDNATPGDTGDDFTVADETAIDLGSGETVTCVFTNNDIEDPVLTVPPDTTLECPADTSPGNTGTATATDNDTTPGFPTVDFSDVSTIGDVCAGTGTITRTWTATDACGNTDTADQIITVEDTTDPVLNGVPDDVTLECDQDLPAANVTATDTCDTDPEVTMTTLSDTRGDVCAGVGQVVRQWTATDCTGNSVSAQQTVTFEDTTNPVLSGVPADATLECDQDVPPATVTATDNCDADPTITMTTGGTRDDVCAGVGTVIRTWTATDCSGNQTSQTQTLTFVDTTDPVISGVPGDVTLECDQDLPTVTPTATDNCDADPAITMTTDVDTRGDVCAGVGVVTRTWTATDCSGNTDSASQTVTFEDTTDPVISGVPGDVTLECDQDLPTVTPTATDNCDADPDITMTTDVDTRGDVCAGVGVVTRTWTATDCSGNTDSASQTVTFEDTTDPVLSGVPGDVTLECDQDLPTVNPTATDNCDADPDITMTTDVDTRGDVCAGVGVVTRTWTATDCSGNTDSASQTVTFEDTTDPVISGVPGDVTLECDQDLPTVNPTATDNCDADPDITMTTDVDTRGDVCAGVGVVTRTWTATDCSGNTDSASQTVTFEDTTDPVISGVPGDVTLECDQDLPTVNPTATDNCDLDPDITMTTDVDTRGDVCAGVGVVTRTWTATDCSGNTDSASQTVTFEDTTDPVISGVPGDVTLECDQDLPTVNPTATDNCDADPAITMTTDVDTRGDVCAGVGVVTRTWTATDCSGNTDSASQTVTFEDTTDPVLSGVPADATLECDQDLPGANVTATDNCDADPDVAMTILSDTRGDVCAGVGQVVRQWTATDCTGNSVSASQTVTFEDTTDPVISGVPADATLECDEDIPAANVTATDNCDPDPDVTLETQDNRGGVCAAVGTVVRTWTATDCTGNSVSASQTLTFVDTTDPVFNEVLPPDETIECDQDLTPATLTGSDNCAPEPTVTFDEDGSGITTCGGTGILVRTWTVTDCEGNSTSHTQTLTIVDTTDPELVGVPADTTLECDQDLPPADVTATDNCDTDPTVEMTILSDTRGDVCAGVGQVVRQWTATDCAGNSTSAQQTVTFVDTTPPDLQLPANIEVGCFADTTPANTGFATATDNCDANPTVTFTDVGAPPVCGPPADIIRTWTATDCSGNSTSGDQIITVNCPCGEIIIKKETDPDGDQTLFDFTPTGYGAPFQLADGGQNSSGPLVPLATYSVAETVPSGWLLTDITCDDESVGDVINTQGVDIFVSPGEVVTCTFTNEMADFMVTKSCVEEPVPLGSAVMFNIDVKNTGYVDLVVDITDLDLPIDPGNADGDGDENTYNGIALAANGGATQSCRAPGDLDLGEDGVWDDDPSDGCFRLTASIIATQNPVTNFVTADATLAPPLDQVPDPDTGQPWTAQRTDDASCDVIVGATRTLGFWKTHYNYTCHVAGEDLDGDPAHVSNSLYLPLPIDLGYTELETCGDVFGVFWSSVPKNSDGERRERTCQASLHTAWQLLAAILNTGFLNAGDVPIVPLDATGALEPYRDMSIIMAAQMAMASCVDPDGNWDPDLAGCDRDAIIQLGGLLGDYNESGDSVAIVDADGKMVAPADPNAAKAIANEPIADCGENTGANSKGGRRREEDGTGTTETTPTVPPVEEPVVTPTFEPVPAPVEEPVVEQSTPVEPVVEEIVPQEAPIEVAPVEPEQPLEAPAESVVEAAEAAPARSDLPGSIGYVLPTTGEDPEVEVSDAEQLGDDAADGGSAAALTVEHLTFLMNEDGLGLSGVLKLAGTGPEALLTDLRLGVSYRTASDLPWLAVDESATCAFDSELPVALPPAAAASVAFDCSLSSAVPAGAAVRVRAEVQDSNGGSASREVAHGL